MSEKISAAQDVRNLARLYQNMIRAADMLESIGSYEQALSENKIALVKAAEALKIAQDQVRFENAKFKDAEILNERTVENVRVECDQILIAAKAQAKSITDDAHVAAAKTTQNADEAASVAINAAQGKVASLYDIIKSKTASLDELQKQIAQAESDLIKLDQARATARQAVEKMLGE